MIGISEAEADLGEKPACLTLLRAWLDWRRGPSVQLSDPGSAIPMTEDVRPELIGTLLPYVTVFNIEPDGTTGYSLAGARHRDLMQLDLRGRGLLQVTPPGDRDERLRRWRPIPGYPCGMMSHGLFVRESGDTTHYTSLALPVRVSPDAPPTKVYAAIDDQGGPIRDDIDPVREIPLAFEIRYIDLGFGAPAPIMPPRPAPACDL